MTIGQPMPAPTFHILAAMLGGPLHGYAIIKRAHDLSEGRVRLAAGTLYAALDRLRDAGLVELDHEETVNGRARRCYRLSGAGREAVRDEARRMAAAAAVVLGHAGVRR
jgi:PadR family transcriptional regulator, regulatory protein PadR